MDQAIIKKINKYSTREKIFWHNNMAEFTESHVLLNQNTVKTNFFQIIIKQDKANVKN